VGRVTWWQPAAGKLIEDLIRELTAVGKAVSVSSAVSRPDLTEALSDLPEEALATSNTLDPALEWCENIILHREGANGASGRTVDFADNDLVHGLDAPAISALQSVLTRREFTAGDHIIRAGDQASSLFLLERGEASVLADGVGRRLATYSAGTAFGEMAFLGQLTRTADVRADTDCLCYELHKDDFTRLTAEASWLAATMYANLGRKLAANLAQANLEIAALHSGH
jgi:glutaminase